LKPDFPEHLRPPVQADSENNVEKPADDWVPLSEIEGRYVARVLEHTGGNKQAAARILAVDRKTLDRMIKRHHIDTHHTRGRAKGSSTP
jgi:DNA-binding NtrC family response regulator